jgi:hypothetical protein
MPSNKPRVTVTLNESTYEVIKALARLQDRSAGSVIGEYLETVEEPLRRLVALLQTAEEAPEKFRHQLAGVLVHQQVEIENMLGQTMHGLFDELEAPNPLSGNTGVRSVDNPKTKPRARRRKS